MKCKLAAVFAALLLAGVVPTVVRADDKAVRKEIEGMYAKIVTAMKHKNVQAIMEMGTPDFTMKELKGPPVKAKDVAAQMQAQMATVKSVDSCTMTLDKLVVKGNTAVATENNATAMTVLGQKKGETHKVTSKGTTEDTFVKTPKGWKFKSVNTIKDIMTMDGKPYNPMAMAPPAPKKK
jgi:ketosteroid isomerase-like protein